MATTSRTVTCRLHGTGIAACGSYPEISVEVTVECSRDPGSSTVHWEVTHIDWNHSPSGRFGYAFYASICIDDGEHHLIMSKPDTGAGNNWWNSMTLYSPSGSFTSTSDSTTFNFYVEGRHCMDNGHYCYDVSGDYYIDWFYMPLPTYETFYTVSYNANGGVGAPQSQQKSNLSTLTLSNQIPSRPVTINYYNNADGSLSNTTTANRQFVNWSASNGGTYNPGGSYTKNETCTMTANWSDASFIPITIPDRYVRITYNYNGGTGTPATASLARTKDGYATSPSGSATYTPGTTGYTTTDLNLYPKYGNATLPYSSLPVASKSGYRFDGWYYDSTLTNKVTGNVVTATDITLYAKWGALPIHQYQVNGTWGNIGPYVWRFNGTNWEKVAHIRKFNGTTWIDISEG